MEHEIVVEGTGEVRVMPDRATVHVVVDGEGSSRQEAYDAAARSAAAVDAVLKAEADAFERIATAALIVQPRTRWQDGQSVRTGWTAARTSVLEIGALDRLGDLLAQLANSGGNISGLTWGLDPANVAPGEARSRAAQDARQRAEQYAATLGVKVGVVAWVAEPGLRAVDHPPSPPARLAAARMEAPMAPETIDVSPEELTITAAVEVGFTLVEG
jgi:uncharacterized protein YggE